MTEAKYNPRNPAVKRIFKAQDPSEFSRSKGIFQEIQEMAKDDSLDFVAQAFEENIFEWHFVLRGPSDTDFEGGLYHGRILLPAEYPMKPPSFIMLTKNGRFETNTRICLSISDYHPENWQPVWGVQSALRALVAFFPTPGEGALGSIETTSEVRKRLATMSRNQRFDFGSKERQQLAKDLHEKLVERIQKAAGVWMGPSAQPSSSGRSIVSSADSMPGESSFAKNGLSPEGAQQNVAQADWISPLTFIIGILIIAILIRKFL